MTLVESILSRIDAARESADVAANYDDRNSHRYNEGRLAAYVDVLWMLGADAEVEA